LQPFRNKKDMETTTTLLEGYSDLEKGAYLSAIASLATADRQATSEELEYITSLCQSAGLSSEQEAYVLQAARETNGAELQHSLDVLKGSELRFSLVADLIAFAKADQDYSEEEQQNVSRIAQYLGVNGEQFSTLNQFVDKASATDMDPQQMQQQGFFGLGDKMQSSGMGNGFLKGLISFAGPMVLGSLLSRGLGRRGGAMGGALGGMLGGGLGGMLGGSRSGGLGGMMGGGGLGSIIGSLAGGRGLGSTGGLLGRMLGGRF
jgi:uncharacterized tellurite resistance protein B-like protein